MLLPRPLFRFDASYGPRLSSAILNASRFRVSFTLASRAAYTSRIRWSVSSTCRCVYSSRDDYLFFAILYALPVDSSTLSTASRLAVLMIWLHSICKTV